MRTNALRNQLLAVCLAVLSAGMIAPQTASSQNEIRAVMDAQVAAWNRGDVEGFMAGYEPSETTTFVGTSITRGYQRVLENYHRRYATKAQMGRLTFSELEIKLLGSDYASVIGRWRLVRSADAGGEVGGIFTLLFHRTAGGWRIILDHTS